MITNRQIAFGIAYVFSFIALGTIGYLVGDYSLRSKPHKTETPKMSVIDADTAFYDLPHMNMSLISSGGDHSMVRLDMTLEVQKGDLARLDSYQPRITDHLVNYFQKQDLETLRQASKHNDFKAQLLEETNKASYPIQIMDIVFRRFVIL